MELSQGNLGKRDTMLRAGKLVESPKGDFLKNPIEYPFGVIELAKLQMGDGHPGGCTENYVPFSNVPGGRQCFLGYLDYCIPVTLVQVGLGFHRMECP